ncbi:MAG: hypothetical protein HC805_05110 [Alkalinema sp. RL_2_19]|nr:hypothetical protein [Alkalinema sp. RL_2_19]
MTGGAAITVEAAAATAAVAATLPFLPLAAGFGPPPFLLAGFQLLVLQLALVLQLLRLAHYQILRV